MNEARLRQTAARAIESFALDLGDLSVLTEAATGAFAVTAPMAALAGARRVLALARDSAWGTLEAAGEATLALARRFGVADRIEIVQSRNDARLREAEVVTNLGAVRPLDAAFLDRLGPHAAIALMWETWEHRPDELDLAGCRARGIPVLGTDESHPLLGTFEYAAALSAKLLLSLDLELHGTRVVVVGSGRYVDALSRGLPRMGVTLDVFACDELASAHARRALVGADAIVFAEPRDGRLLVGPGGCLEAEELRALNPAIAVAHVVGAVDRAALRAAGLPCAPERFAPAGHMSVTMAHLGPRPMVDLHAAGLKVGAALARARRRGLDGERAEREVLEQLPLAQGFSAAPAIAEPRDDDILITIDVDWAPDCAIDFTAALLAEHRVRATWFITHASPALERLRSRPDLFELGIHPSFQAGSSHGADPLRHCLELVPDATALRAHGLVQSTALLDRLATETAIEIEASTLLPHAAHLAAAPHPAGKRLLLRLPYFWEDAFEMRFARPQFALAPLLGVPGLKVFSFHPIHVYMDARDADAYERLKRRVPRLSEAQDIGPPARPSQGTQAMLLDLVRHLGERGGGSTLRMRAPAWRAALP